MQEPDSWTHALAAAQCPAVTLEREVIYTEDVEAILGKRQWTSRSDELNALNEAARAKQVANATPPPYIKKEDDHPTPAPSEEETEEEPAESK